MKNQEVKNNIEIGGAILTPELIDWLKGMQNHDNEDIQLARETIADAVCFIGSVFYMFDNELEKKRAAKSMADLSNVRDSFDKMCKP